MKIGDQVQYFTDLHPGTITDIWNEPGVGWVAEVNHEYTCFLDDLVPIDDGS